MAGGMAVIRATKLRASICKSLLPSTESVDTHISEQCTALQSAYPCSIVFTDTGESYTLFVQRHDRKKMTSSVIETVLDENYTPPEKYVHATGVVVKTIGEMRRHGGSRGGARITNDDGDAAWNDDRHDEFEIYPIGQEECTLDTISLEKLAVALSRASFFDTVQCFGYYVQHATISNHNFLVNQKDSVSKYLTTGASYFVWQSKKTVCREVFSNWVHKFSEMVDENQSELDMEAVTVFREKKQEYLEGVAADSPSVARSEKLAVIAVSQTAKSKREQMYGKNVVLVGRRT